MGLHGAPDAQVIDREDIWSLELEHQVHLDRPAAKTLDPRPLRDNVLV